MDESPFTVQPTSTYGYGGTGGYGVRSTEYRVLYGVHRASCVCPCVRIPGEMISIILQVNSLCNVYSTAIFYLKWFHAADHSGTLFCRKFQGFLLPLFHQASFESVWFLGGDLFHGEEIVPDNHINSAFFISVSCMNTGSIFAITFIRSKKLWSKAIWTQDFSTKLWNWKSFADFPWNWKFVVLLTVGDFYNRQLFMSVTLNRR